MLALLMYAIPAISAVGSMTYCLFNTTTKNCMRGVADDINEFAKEVVVLPLHNCIRSTYVKPKSDYDLISISLNIDEDEDITKTSALDLYKKEFLREDTKNRFLDLDARDEEILQRRNHALLANENGGDEDVPALPPIRDVYLDESETEPVVHPVECKVISYSNPVDDLHKHLITLSFGSNKLDPVLLRAEAKIYLTKHYSKDGINEKFFEQIVFEVLRRYIQPKATDRLFDDYSLLHTKNK